MPEATDLDLSILILNTINKLVFICRNVRLLIEQTKYKMPIRFPTYAKPPPQLKACFGLVVGVDSIIY